MARPDNFEAHPLTRQGRSAGGFPRPLPNLGAGGAELRKIHLNGGLESDASIQDLRVHLGVTNLTSGYGRNFRNPSFSLSEVPPETEATWKES